jgi:hypothetical protein
LIGVAKLQADAKTPFQTPEEQHVAYGLGQG